MADLNNIVADLEDCLNSPVQKKVITVNENEDAMQLMSRILADIGYLWQNVDEYDMAREALELAVQKDPDNKQAKYICRAA